MACRSGAGFGHIHMRIGAKTDQHIDIRNKIFRDIAMKIERRGDGQIRPDDLAQTANQLPFPVVEMFSHHGAVQVQKDPVERPGISDAFDDLTGDRLIGVAAYMGRGDCPCPEDRNDIPTLSPPNPQRARHAKIDLLESGQHRRAAHHGDIAAAASESLHIRWIGGECVRLVQKARNSDAHSRTTSQTCLLRLTSPFICGTAPLEYRIAIHL